jgi:hypothetical protein
VVDRQLPVLVDQGHLHPHRREGIKKWNRRGCSAVGQVVLRSVVCSARVFSSVMHTVCVNDPVQFRRVVFLLVSDLSFSGLGYYVSYIHTAQLECTDFCLMCTSCHVSLFDNLN